MTLRILDIDNCIKMGKSYKLHYFNSRGRGEVCRLLFAAAGVEYEDIRIPVSEWPKHKAEMPLGQMPVLEIDGAKFGQSYAIARYLANEFGLNGTNNLEGLHIDMIIDTLSDLGKKYPFWEKDEKKKAELEKVFLEQTFADGLKLIEKLFVEHNGGEGFFVNKLSVADLEFTSMLYFLLTLKQDILDCVPKLKALYKRVNDVPNIKAWLEKRPKTEF